MQSRFILIAVVAVLAFDLVASTASRVLGFPYAHAAIGSYVIYFLIGLYTARSTPSRRVWAAARMAGVAGLADASIGWAISWHVGPGRLVGHQPLTVTLWILIALWVVILAAAIGSVGGLIGRGMQPAAVPVP